jgi:hypothetical protein
MSSAAAVAAPLEKPLLPLLSTPSAPPPSKHDSGPLGFCCSVASASMHMTSSEPSSREGSCSSAAPAFQELSPLLASARSSVDPATCGDVPTAPSPERSPKGGPSSRLAAPLAVDVTDSTSPAKDDKASPSMQQRRSPRKQASAAIHPPQLLAPYTTRSRQPSADLACAGDVAKAASAVMAALLRPPVAVPIRSSKDANVSPPAAVTLRSQGSQIRRAGSVPVPADMIREDESPERLPDRQLRTQELQRGTFVAPAPVATPAASQAHADFAGEDVAAVAAAAAATAAAAAVAKAATITVVRGGRPAQVPLSRQASVVAVEAAAQLRSASTMCLMSRMASDVGDGCADSDGAAAAGDSPVYGGQGGPGERRPSRTVSMRRPSEQSPGVAAAPSQSRRSYAGVGLAVAPPPRGYSSAFGNEELLVPGGCVPALHVASRVRRSQELRPGVL